MKRLRAGCLGIALALFLSPSAAAQPIGDAQAAGPQSSLVGRVVPAEQLAAGWSVPGRLIEIRVQEGDRVKRGDVLARLDGRLYEIKLEAAKARYEATRAGFEMLRGEPAQELEAVQAELAAAKAQLQLAEAHLKRAESLHAAAAISAEALGRAQAEHASAQGAVALIEKRLATLRQGGPRAQLAKAEAELKIAEAELKAAELTLTETVLNSPADGIVADVGQLAGDYVQPGRFCRILNDARVRIEAATDDVGKLKIGSKFRVRFPNRDATVEAVLIRILPNRGPQTRLILDLPNKPEAVSLGGAVELEPIE